jgi:hypothetical protein
MDGVETRGGAARLGDDVRAGGEVAGDRLNVMVSS